MLSPLLSLLPSFPVFRLDISRHRKDLDTLDDPSGPQGNSGGPCGPLPWALPGALGSGQGCGYQGRMFDCFYLMYFLMGRRLACLAWPPALTFPVRVSFPLSVQLNTRGNFPRKVLSIFCSADGPLLSAEGWIPPSVFYLALSRPCKCFCLSPALC